MRRVRNRSALTQEELCNLVDISQSTLSELELFREATSLDTALALQVVFGTQPRKLFSVLYARIENAVMGRAASLDQKLRDKTDARSLRKLRTLDDMVKRATSQTTEL
ncbi:helix-turn-helix transcriptional regulator [Sphingomonas sp. SUN039]|uniref:helix-turn-helix transcriptional regulator n=1 Tax=Sphingomonas sp. SUN039 TaxID=2937787 RepID=UPI002164AD52|nr:helix-turn-helix domain-containing protein [Sphingomonas sp. SUN039]UVO53066.1 helix-turn-helix domain-containing protein [Sphingomonas sp. SUN039]